MSIEWTDLVTIGLLVVLEGLLSADNALVMAVMVLVLPDSQRRKALQYGILGAFALRTVAIFFAAWLIKLHWVKLVGGLYLLYLPLKHFMSHPPDEEDAGPRAGMLLGLSLFWSTVVMVNLVDLVFAIDSILAAVGLAPKDAEGHAKLWVVIVGAMLGIVAIRLVAGQVLVIIKRYPALVDGAYLIIAWVGLKLDVEYFHAVHLLPWDIPHAFSIGVVVLLFIASYIYARLRGPANAAEETVEAVALVEEAPRQAPSNREMSDEAGRLTP